MSRTDFYKTFFIHVRPYIISLFVVFFAFLTVSCKMEKKEALDPATSLPYAEDEYWWGGSVADGSKMPYGRVLFGHDQWGDIKGNQGQPLLISNKGQVVWANSPLSFEFKEDILSIRSYEGPVEHLQAGATLKDAYLLASKRYFPPAGTLPDTLLFTQPQYNTWIELLHDQNQEDILKYARAIIDNGFPPGVFMIDDNWQTDYGVWDFSAERFTDPKAMMDELHKMGFKVMLWVCPFVSPDSRVYRALRDQKLLVTEDSSRNTPALVRWWNGASALLDLSSPEGKKWFTDRLLYLQQTYDVDGFKLDAGDPEYYKNVFASKELLPNDHTELFASIGLAFPLNEYRACWKMAGQPLAQRLRDKEHTWDHLRSLVPDMIAQGLMGYAFTCPDMIGGGESTSFTDSTILDEELIVRSAQCHALMPMMQFSVAPWRVLNEKNLKICLEMARLHGRMGEEIKEIAKQSAISGEPMVRPLEYMFPGQGYEKVIDQFMLGEEILVAPVLVKGAVTRKVIFPPGRWSAEDGTEYQGGTTTEVEAPLDRLPWFRKVKISPSE